MGYRNNANRFLRTLEKYHVLILQHLTPKEILKLTEVEDSINTTFSSCAHCLCKFYIKINFNRHRDPRKYEIIVKSKRLYRNFKFICKNNESYSMHALYIANIFYNSISHIVIKGLNMRRCSMDLDMPKLKYILISYADMYSVSTVIRACKEHHMLKLEHVQLPTDRCYNDSIMGFRNVRLLNSHIAGLMNVDFMHNNCVDFEYEVDRKDDYEHLCKIFKDVINCEELKIRKKSTYGYKLIIRRNNQKFDRSSTEFSVFMRKKRKIENKISYLSRWNFSIILELYEFDINLIKKLGNALRSLKNLEIFEIPMNLHKFIFECFDNLQVIKSACYDEMQSEFYVTRTMYEYDESFDPMEFDHKTIDLILQHLDYEEIIKASEVNTKWNKIISASTHFNRKFIVKLNSRDFVTKKHEQIMRGQRIHENFDIKFNCDPMQVPKIFDLLDMYANFITDLRLSSLLYDSIKSPLAIKFKQLKKLTLNDIDEDFCRLIMEYLTTLEEVHLEGFNFSFDMFFFMKNQKNLKKFKLVNCRFESFTRLIEEKDFDLEKLRDLEISFTHSKNWKTIETSEGFNNFFKRLTNKTIENLKICGIRGKVLSKILNKMKNLKNIELNNFWPSDLENMEVNQLKVNIYVPNNYYIDNINWRKKFRGLKTLAVGSIFDAPIFTSSNDQKFIKLMRNNWKQVSEKFQFQFDGSTLGSHDPLICIPEDLHDLIFQHLPTKARLNAAEVSKHWNCYVKNSKVAMRRMTYELPKEISTNEKEIVLNCEAKFDKVNCFGAQLSLLINIAENIKVLKVFTFSTPKEITLVKFPNLEELTVQRQFFSMQSESVGSILGYFVDCVNLKSLIITENLYSSSHSAFKRILANNSNLKTLKVYICKEYEKLFENDFSHSIDFRLDHLTFDIGNVRYNSRKIEDNFVSFIHVHAETLKELHMRQASGRMFTEIFSNFKALETFFVTHVEEIDKINGHPSQSILQFTAPNDITPNHTARFLTFLPKLEYLYVSSLNLELLQQIVIRMKNLKLLSFHNERDNCTRNYDQLMADNAEVFNGTIQFIKLTKASEFEKMSFDKFFVKKWYHT